MSHIEKENATKIFYIITLLAQLVNVSPKAHDKNRLLEMYLL